MILFVRGWGVAYLAVSAVGTMIAIRDELPANFANWDLGTSNITRDFLIGAGTALSAPLVLLIALAVLLVLCGRPTNAGRISLVLLIVLAIGFVIGIVGEPVARDALESAGAHLDRTVVVIAAIVLPLMIAVTAQAAYQIHGQGEPL